ncbi:hypothetical protein CAEBREN_16700 [Caenorhabditis brenneri]|uniref:Uncharacterized protein n=1 Tax=Caenorhabditis brenneri TaxID=135651 RepID=G0MBF4_CAEBE|nr:hypothetical protein CAEBREN_16700 [Caenorhabditis brenneri]
MQSILGKRKRILTLEEFDESSPNQNDGEPAAKKAKIDIKFYDDNDGLGKRKRTLTKEEFDEASPNQNGGEQAAKKAKIDIKLNGDKKGKVSLNAKSEHKLKPELKKTSKTVVKYEWVTDEDELDVGDAIAEKNYSQLYRKGKRIQLLEKLFRRKWLNYCIWKRKSELKQASEFDQKSNMASRNQNDEEPAAKTSEIDHKFNDDKEGKVSLDAKSEHKLKPELEKTSNTVDNYEWVTDEDELDVGDAIAEKDYSQLYGKGKRIRLLEKLFEQKWLNYSQWKREREFEEAYNIDLDF